jgi:hypothetical protein
MANAENITLVLGGARSGKSRYAESLIAALPPPWLPPWTYLATAEASDTEMAARIATHRARRGPQWQTIEAPRDLAAALKSRETMPMLVDCLTLWLSNLMLADTDIDAEIARLKQRWRIPVRRWYWSPMKSAPASCRIIRSVGAFAICRAFSTSASRRVPIASSSSSLVYRSPSKERCRVTP